MATKIRKCRRCEAEVTDNELVMLMALMAKELDEMITEGARETGASKTEVAERLIMPLIRDTTVCIKCFEEVNERIPVAMFLSDPLIQHASFVWERIRLDVLDAS